MSSALGNTGRVIRVYSRATVNLPAFRVVYRDLDGEPYWAHGVGSIAVDELATNSATTDDRIVGVTQWGGISPGRLGFLVNDGLCLIEVEPAQTVDLNQEVVVAGSSGRIRSRAIEADIAGGTEISPIGICMSNEFTIPVSGSSGAKQDFYADNLVVAPTAETVPQTITVALVNLNLANIPHRTLSA